jgi:hypothetical protein
MKRANEHTPTPWPVRAGAGQIRGQIRQIQQLSVSGPYKWCESDTLMGVDLLDQKFE